MQGVDTPNPRLYRLLLSTVGFASCLGRDADSAVVAIAERASPCTARGKCSSGMSSWLFVKRYSTRVPLGQS